MAGQYPLEALLRPAVELYTTTVCFTAAALCIVAPWTFALTPLFGIVAALITAVKLQNASAQHLALDPRDLMGNFVAATFQHPYLGPRGDASDTTTVYLVTRGRGLAVTAVKLQNANAQHLALDPRDLMGNFVAATFQHPYLGARGDASDTTTVYLVTRGRGLA